MVEEVEAGVEVIKESTELAHAAGRLAAFAKSRLADGAQADDALALGKRMIDDESFRTDLITGIVGVQKVIPEIKANHSFDELAAVGAAFIAGFKEG